MGSAQVGDRVVAVRNSDTGTVYMYGRGTYAGRQPGYLSVRGQL